MRETDFNYYDIKHFTKKEIELTGAVLSDVSLKLILRLNNLRKMAKIPFKLILNGLTTGEHNCKLHKMGYAVDFYPICKKNDSNYKEWIYQAINCKFSGIGVYYCQEVGIVTMHLDIRRRFASWLGTKEKKTDNWNYLSLFADLKGL